MDDGRLRLVGLTKRFGDVVAVDDLDLEVEPGHFVAFLGPSGCGKTTTLRMIAGLERPTSGRVHLGDSDITELKPYKRPVNTVFQSYALFPHLNVADNVAFGLARKGIKGPEAQRQVDDMLQLMQLDGYGKRRISELSGGQQQRVALARALVNHPKMLLLDEPLGALDLKLRKQMQIELKRIQTEVGITFVHVTHDQEEAMTMADTIAVMHAGRIEQLGSPVELYERPVTPFVANFLGQSNLLHGRVEQRDGEHAALSVGDAKVRIPASALNGGSSAHIGVRPEKIRLHADDSAVPDTYNRLAGTVVDASYVGVSTQYLVATRGGPRVMVYEQNVERASKAELRAPGEDVVLAWSPDHSFVVPIEQPETAQPAA